MDSSEKMNSIIYMDHVLFKAAAEGNIGPFEDYQTCLHQLLTPDENTILHVYLKNQRREPEFTDFVDIILEMCPLLFQANKKGEIPLHLAARYGHSNVVTVLIDCAKALPLDPESGVSEAKKMLRMTTEEKDTALHVAARNNRGHVVEILTKEDPEFSYSANVHGETPLYIAVSNTPTWSRRRRHVVDGILGNCISVDYGGPNGRTALHEASRAGYLVSATARKLLEKEKKLTKTTDENGWSPLHYAAYYDWSARTVKVLLEYDASAAYIAETEKKRTALHIAAIRGHVNAMKEIVSGCSACCELVDNRGWNALHYAVASKRSRVFKECLRIPELAILKTEKDDKGNTPYHLIAALAHEQKQWRRVLYEYRFSEGEIYGLNKGKLSVKNFYKGEFEEIQKEILESLEDTGIGPLDSGVFRIKNVERKKELKDALSKARESQLVVAALIATVTFAAAVTLPGGYKSDRGTAILAKKAAFIVFVISDTMSLVLSTLTVFIHFLISLIKGWEMFSDKEIDGGTTEILFVVATSLTMIGMGTMIIAFITGTYAVLEPSLGLVISTCLIGLSFFFFMYFVLRFVTPNITAVFKNINSLVLIWKKEQISDIWSF